MASFEEQVQQAVDARDIPGVILLAGDAKGTFKYEKAFGPKTLTEPMDLNATFILASCTKLMTTIAALQCVERGQIGLDDSVSAILPELKEPEIFNGENEKGELTFQKAKTAITLKHLLTHSSGLGYHTMDPRYIKWRTLRGEDFFIKGWSIIPRINTPLLFEPGTSWAYGTGLDWAGILISRLNNMSLEAYMQKYIWTPLGIKNNYFTGRKKGTLTWSGMPNLQWTIDREAGICALYAGNMLPFGDFASGDIQVKFEKEIYARAAKASRL